MAMLLLAAVAYANVIGIDYGGESMKVALVQPGSPLEIVTNHFSKRKTDTAVAFVRGERLFGSDAMGMLSRKPELAYARLLSLLGKFDVAHPQVEWLTSRTYLPMKVRFNATRYALSLAAGDTSAYGGGWEEWTVEELVAMILTYAKDITRAYGGNVVRDCVVAVPSYATHFERQAMLQAAALADFRVLSLIDQNTAAAVQFGLDRLFDEKRRVLFYNVGSDSAQAAIVEYSTYQEKNQKTVGQLEVLGKGWALDAGSFAVDLALTELLATEFEAKFGTPIRDSPKPMAKIRASAKKTKEVLSANTEHHVFVPSLHDDHDFATTVTRGQLEAAAALVFAALPGPIERALTAANLTADDLDAVEIIGGGVRVPKVQQTLKEFLSTKRSPDKPPLELSVHLNGDEAVALGAAFHGANVSTSFRVRKVGLQDVTPFAVGVRMASGAWHKRATLFKSGAKQTSKPKTIAFQHDADIVCELAYDDPDSLPPGTPTTIAMYDVTGIADFAAEMSKQNTSGTLQRPKVQLSFVLDSSGLTTLSKAEVSVTEESPVNETVAQDEAAPAVANDTNASDANATNTTNATNATAAVAPKKKTHKRTLTVTQTKSGPRDFAMLAADAEAAALRIETIYKAEQVRMERERERNDLESTIYAVRNALNDREDEVAPVSTDAQRDAVRADCETLEEWLYDADGASVDELKDKRRSLQDKWDAILERADEARKRPSAIERANKALASARKNATEVWPVSKPWLEIDDLDDLVAKIDKAQKWLDDVVALQEKTPAHEPPAFFAEDIVSKLKPVASASAKLGAKLKPKPPAPNVTNASNATADNTTANATVDDDANITDDESWDEL